MFGIKDKKVVSYIKIFALPCALLQTINLCLEYYSNGYNSKYASILILSALLISSYRLIKKYESFVSWAVLAVIITFFTQIAILDISKVALSINNDQLENEVNRLKIKLKSQKNSQLQMASIRKVVIELKKKYEQYSDKEKNNNIINIIPQLKVMGFYEDLLISLRATKIELETIGATEEKITLKQLLLLLEEIRLRTLIDLKKKMLEK